MGVVFTEPGKRVKLTLFDGSVRRALFPGQRGS